MSIISKEYYETQNFMLDLVLTPLIDLDERGKSTGYTRLASRSLAPPWANWLIYYPPILTITKGLSIMINIMILSGEGVK